MAVANDNGSTTPFSLRWNLPEPFPQNLQIPPQQAIIKVGLHCYLGTKFVSVIYTDARLMFWLTFSKIA